MIRACGAAIADGHTLTSWPCVSKAIEPQTAGGFCSDVACRLLPSGPARSYASVIHVSLWMLLFGFLARNGFCGGLVVLWTGLPLNACPEKAGSDGGGGTDGIDTADALPAVTASAIAVTEITPQARTTRGTLSEVDQAEA